MSLALKPLFVETITAPRDAAQQIIALGVSRKTSIMCVIFTICLTVILFFLDLNSSENPIIFPLLMHHPLVLASVMIFGTIWSAFVIGFFGKILGGNENVDHILVLLAWGQAVQVGFQVIATVIALLSIQLAALFQLIVFFIYIWIFISFIDVALKLENLFKAFFVTFSGLVAAFISVSMVLSLIFGLTNV
tara:strand:- start:1077 stop:1649 length:573 start_codon:yes stop_codon:yes gene_type:complete